LEILLMSRNGRALEAATTLRQHYQSGHFDLNLVQAGYSLGLEMGNRELAREALELQIKIWPNLAADAQQKLDALQQESAGSPGLTSNNRP
jgi:hypothetical protein